MDPFFQKATQNIEETPAERAFRYAGKFQDVESSLAANDIAASHVPAPTTRIYSLLHALRSYLPPLSTQLFDKISSYLGHRNPLACPARDPSDAVWLLDNTAYRPAHSSSSPPSEHHKVTRQWRAEFVACYFARDSGKDVSRWVADIADKVGLQGMDIPDEEGKKRIEERVRPFLEGIRPARWVDVVLCGEEGKVRRLGPGGRNAVSSQVVGPLGRQYEEGAVAQTGVVHPELAPYGSMNTYFAGPEGWIVISDIDDTIKITQTPDPIGILRTTFVSTPTTTTGMPSLYTTLNTILSSPHWFYLSASPYNLYPFLRPFLLAHYPPGTILLRETSWITPSGLLQALTQGVQAFKVSRMDRIHEWLPQRRVLCVGDSTQSDPEAYAEVYRKYPGWVRAVFIRKVLDVGGMEKKNLPERFEKAFEGVPRSVWRVFEDPVELGQAVEGLKTM